ncbi:tRNA (guanine(46)-N(7))-methyltransferase TrmB [Microvirga pudoricolor]|uniref:tRNA (guanine(46)-N(7))-methyltransferase TrmB n=1 Tax=Microvirga pudoricolor TaxID=2778729 RepID=UPI00194FA422|nr:tRNA (guanine(46)-N(7))-methyltransferase TrmB [Microvirga pudoricolor]MBM6593878.1 tRNA (guanosine(46)-N7)-methyltransferase TrmB [Microvirga pudoricolor]
MTAASEGTGAFFGRRKGKRLRAGQDDLVQNLLPALRVAPGAALSELFPAPGRETWLEIGFGGGEHLAAQARAHPDVNIIGCEPFLNGMAKMLALIDGEGLTNVRLWDDDVTHLLPALPEAAFDRVYILYPDPWPKRRQRKRRLVSDETLSLLARVMRPGAQLRFATDIDDYAGWGIARILRSPDFRWTAARPDDWRRPWAGWPGTRYEAKALREGRVPSYLTFVRV